MFLAPRHFHLLGVALWLAIFATPSLGQSLKQDKAGQMMIDGVLITTGQKLPSAAVLDPWAPATDLTTFAEIARQRPAGCEADFILCWLADQQARDGKPAAFDELNWYQRALNIPFQRLGAIHYGWQEQLWDTRLPYWTPQSAPIAEELQRETALGMSTYILMIGTCMGRNDQAHRLQPTKRPSGKPPMDGEHCCW